MNKKETKTTVTTKATKTAAVDKAVVADQTAKPKTTATAKTKKAATAKATKEVAAKPVKKAAVTKESPKKAEPLAAKATAPKARETVKVTEKAEKKATEKTVKASTAKTTAAKKTTAGKAKKSPAAKVSKQATKAKTKASSKTADTKAKQEKLAYYQSLSVDECIRLMQNMNVQYGYDDYYRLLMDEADSKKLIKNIIDGNGITAKKFDFAQHGYDQDLVAVTIAKVGDTMDLKAADFKTIKKAMQQAVSTSMSMDAEQNAAAYLAAFQTAEKLLMLGQRKDIRSAAEISTIVDQDVAAFFEHFFQFAYELLPTWQYNDVKFYEDFAYAVLSQYSDLFDAQQLRIQIDVADLYIKHGDYSHGDEMYGYILRDNQIKDYIYFRYASVYQDIDMNKAKAIAYSSMQYVNDRFTYYPDIMKIVNNN